MQNNLQTILTILLFIVLFMSIGWMAPVLHTTYAPEDNFVEMHSFEVQDTHVDADSHNLCLNRTVHRPADADITVEMLLVKDDGTIIEQDSFSVDAYYQKGSDRIIVPRAIRADNLQPGEYRYIESTKLSYYDSRANKEIDFTSEEFRVYESADQIPNQSDKMSC